MAHRLSLRIAAATALTLMAACGGDNGVGPMKPANPSATADNIQALDVTFSSPAFQSFGFASFYSPAATGSLTALRTVLRAAQPTLGARRALSPGESRLAAAALRAALVPADGAISAAVLPPAYLGKTLIYDPSSNSYVDDPTRTDGPSNGVRLILYALDGFGSPVIPLEEIGYADLKDESSSSFDKLHIEVWGTLPDPDVKYLDYAITVTTSSVSVIGFITDGSTQLDFNASISATSNGFVIDIRFDVDAAEAHVRLKLTFAFPDATSFRVTYDFRLQFGTEVVTVTGTETVTDTTDSGKLTVRVNGGIYATITITDGLPSYAGGGGQDLTPEDLTALNTVFEAVAVFTLRFLELLAPTGISL